MAHWGYTDKNGPATWHIEYEIATGKQQSPIDIVTANAKTRDSLKTLKIEYVPEDGPSVQNNGHSIVCTVTKQSELYGGPLDGRYRLVQFHLHWGSNDGCGSEHTVDGKQYSAELHLVHYNTKYGDFSVAVDKPDGLAVIGVFVDVGDENETFQRIVEKIDSLKNKNTSVKLLGSLNIVDLLPSSSKKYWTYAGSLTTPPLFESVRWIVCKDPITFSSEQLQKLRTMSDSDDGPMQDNFRPTVPASADRLVESSD